MPPTGLTIFQTAADGIVAAILAIALVPGLIFASMRFAMVLILVALDEPVHSARRMALNRGSGARLLGAIILDLFSVIALVLRMLTLLAGNGRSAC